MTHRYAPLPPMVWEQGREAVGQPSQVAHRERGLACQRQPLTPLVRRRKLRRLTRQLRKAAFRQSKRRCP